MAVASLLLRVLVLMESKEQTGPCLIRPGEAIAPAGSYARPNTAMNSGYLRQLDGLRALAVANVAWFHWRLMFHPSHALLPGAGFGVETFFVISGFLITGILLDNRCVEPLLALRQFYARRFLRIFPLFYATIVIGCLFKAKGIADIWYWHASYLSNVYFFREGWQGQASHFWSLAVEEQFYLLWPFLVLMLPTRFLFAAIVGCISVAPFFATCMNTMQSGPPDAAVLMPSCMSALGMGALIAYLVRRVHAPALVMRWLLAAGLAGAILWHSFGCPKFLEPFDRLGEDCVLGWLVFTVARGFSGPIGWFLEWAPINYLGKISYGLYVIHNFAERLVLKMIVTLGSPHWMVSPFHTVAGHILFLLAVTVGLASLSWHLFEKPINSLKRFFPYSGQPHLQKPLQTLSRRSFQPFHESRN